MDPWIDGPMDSWVHGSGGPWIHGYTDPWIHRFMDPWIHESMDPYFYYETYFYNEMKSRWPLIFCFSSQKKSAQWKIFGCFCKVFRRFLASQLGVSLPVSLDDSWTIYRRLSDDPPTKQSVSQTIDLVMAINSIQESSKSELSSTTFGHFKVYAISWKCP